MVSNRTQLNAPHPLPATHCLFILYFDTRKRGRGWRVEPERRLEEQQFKKLGRKDHYDWQPINSTVHDKHLPQSPFTGQFFKMTTFCIAFYESYLCTPTVWCPVFIPKNPNFCFLLSFFHPPVWTWRRWMGRGGWGSTVRHSGRITASSHPKSSLVWQLFQSRYICWCRPSWARICKRLRSPESDSKEFIPPAYVAWLASTSKRVVVPARQAGNRFLGFLQGVQIRVLKMLFFRESFLYIKKYRHYFSSGEKENKINKHTGFG